jgi:hypothetical protein
MKIKEAIEKSKEYLVQIIDNPELKSINLEEVKPTDDGVCWDFTFRISESFGIKSQRPFAFSSSHEYFTDLKVIRVRKSDGSFLGMFIREKK